ncbi:GATA transcription factor 17-like [Lolium rigidum]|uniref:GATA transcription factor 17-like n=1 Tax=Lolium rigidum TaxID=89674 RepID=UPI001F5C1CFB|nr:GATA transcription factor 17-like [Lolium rigidum]
MDSSVEKGSGSLDPDGRTASGNPKACTDCYATKTPLWRGGPEGPKSLCNACGIRYRKKRREALGLDGPKRREPVAAAADAACADEDAGGEEEEEDEEQQQETTTKKSKRVGPWGKVTVELRMVGFGKDAVLKQRRRMRRKRRLGEEEKAAILLMALSSGVIYAS